MYNNDLPMELTSSIVVTQITIYKLTSSTPSISKKSREVGKLLIDLYRTDHSEPNQIRFDVAASINNMASN